MANLTNRYAPVTKRPFEKMSAIEKEALKMESSNTAGGLAEKYQDHSPEYVLGIAEALLAMTQERIAKRPQAQPIVAPGQAYDESLFDGQSSPIPQSKSSLFGGPRS
jgi:hypothetical protein